jgi:hypothetical protein
MRLVLILATMILIGVTSGEREYVQVNDFNVSFELNQTHTMRPSMLEMASMVLYPLGLSKVP